MRPTTSSTLARRLARAAVVTGCVFAVTYCGEQGKFPTGTGGGGGGGGGGSSTDVTPPVVSFTFPTPAAGTVQDITDSLKFSIKDTDDVKLGSVNLDVKGIAPFTFSFADSSKFTAAAVVFTKSYVVPLPKNAAGQRVVLTLAALDAAGNVAKPVVDTLAIVDHVAPALTLSAPSAGITVAAGATLTVIGVAQDPSGVARMGAELYVLGGPLNSPIAKSQLQHVYTSALVTKIDTFNLPVPQALQPGAYLVQVFATDSSPTPNADSSAGVAANVVITRPPTGNFLQPAALASVVAGDSLLVQFHATDSSGIRRIAFTGYKVTGVDSLGTTQTVPRFLTRSDTFPLPKDTTIYRYLNAVPTDSSASPPVIYVTATVTNSGGLSATFKDSINIVKGPFVQVTAPLAGGRVPVGVPLAVTLNGYSPDSIKVLGFTAKGIVAGSDSIVYASPLANTQTTVRSIPVAANVPLGVDTVVPFATSSKGSRFLGRAVVVQFADTVKPVVVESLPSKTVLQTVAVGDSVFAVAHVRDNKGVVSLVFTGVALRGNVNLGTDVVVQRYDPRNVTLPQSTDTIVTRYLRASSPIDSTGEFVKIIATATDSSGNVSADTSQVRVVSGPRVSVFQPQDSAVTAAGKQITISVHAKGGQGVRYLGFQATGVFAIRDSVIAVPVNGTLLDTLTFTKTYTIPAATPVGSFAIEPFAVDSTLNPSANIPPVIVVVQAVGTLDVTPPLVQFAVPLRDEVGDSISVTATDPSGIIRAGFIVRNLAGTVIQAESLAYPGTNTFVSQKFSLSLAGIVTTYPTQVTVEAFGLDNAATPNRGVSSFTGTPKSAPADQDTLTIVAGNTIALPQGGQIGDAIVDPVHGGGADPLLILTNTLLDQLEVFHLTSGTFGAAIPVGAQPLGIALWPRDTVGDNADTVIVANSGGTNLSIVDLTSGAEVRRHRLPNYIVETVKTSPTSAGGIQILVTPYDLSDRPQYVGAACRHLTGAACDSVVAVYSTAPTTAQPSPFTSRGYLAWENLSDPTHTSGHFFWEPANAGTDTLQIISVRDTLPGQQIRDTLLGAGVGVEADLTTLAFQDSTFVRNSGDFNHAVIGEGGLNQGFARALSYDGRAGVTTIVAPPCALKNPTSGATIGFLNCNITIDRGVSPGVYVSDFVINRASKVLSVSTNFNGRTNLVRADSIYVFDYTLRQAGLMTIGSGVSGMDMDPNNSFDPATRTSGVLNKNDRLVFAARPDAGIDVFDTYWYQRVATIPIRDTILGPIRVAASGGGLVLAGVTSRGVVVVRLPSVTNPFPAVRNRPITTQARPGATAADRAKRGGTP